MFDQIRKILEMIRFSHTIFALPFAMLAAVMAWNVADHRGEMVPFRLLHLVGLVVCMVFARSAAMAFNRIADRNIDAENPRTSQRHLPSGQLSLNSVILFTALTSLGFIGSTCFFLPNWLPMKLSGPVLVILFVYSLTKRFTFLAHFWLGLSLMLAPLAAWIAIRGDIILQNPADLAPPMVMGLSVLFWVAGFDILYACQDFDFDKQANLKSVPVRFGILGALRIAAVSHAFMVLLLLLLPATSFLGGPDLELGLIYWVGIVALALLLLYEHSLVNPDNLDRVNMAFFNVNAVVSVGLFVVVTLDLLI